MQLPYLTIVLLAVFCTVFAKPAVPADNQCKCPTNWHCGARGFCYLFNFVIQTWTDAKLECEKYDSHLVGIRNNATNAYLQKPENGYGVTYWIGLSKNTADELVWTDRPYKFNTNGFSDWYKGEPNNEGRCGAMVATPIQNAPNQMENAWAMLPCDKKLMSVCYFPLPDEST